MSQKQPVHVLLIYKV